MKKQRRRIWMLLLSMIMVIQSATPIFATEIASESDIGEYTDLQVTDQTLGEETAVDPEILGLTCVTDDANMTAEISGYTGSAAKLDIPEKILVNAKTYTVTSIGKEAFQGNKTITYVKIPKTVTIIKGAQKTIGEIGLNEYYGAFKDATALTTVEFAEGSQLNIIRTHAFNSCTALTTIDIPDGVQTIQSWAFGDCSALTSLNLEKNYQLETIGDHAFCGCSFLTTVEFGENSKIKTIGDDAFSGCAALGSINLPNVLETIGARAFQNTGLTAVQIPASCKTIKSNAFYGCKVLSNVTFEERNGDELTIEDKAFNRCPSWKNIDIPEGVSTLSAYALSGPKNKVSLPVSLSDLNCNVFCDGNVLDERATVNLIILKNPNTVITPNSNITIERIYGEPNGTVENFANNNNIPFNRITDELTLISTEGMKRDYFYGESFDAGGITANAVYASDTEPKTETLSVDNSWEVNGFNATKIGTQKITLTYGGKTIDVGNINVGYNIENSTVTGLQSNVTYTGAPVTQKLTIKSNDTDKTLTEGTDYTISYTEDHTNVGKIEVTVTGIGNYKGTYKTSFNITQKALSDADVKAAVDNVEYTGKKQNPKPTVTYGDVQLTEGTDYTTVYSNETTKPGKGSLTIYAIPGGNYSGETVLDFNILPRNMENVVIKDIPDQIYTGENLKPALEIYSDATESVELTEGTDYTAKYSKNKEIGTASVYIEACGDNYTGSVTKNFEIVSITDDPTDNPETKKDLKFAEVTLAGEKYTYTGGEIKPEIISVIIDGVTLKEDTDYSVSYENNTNVGTASVVITGQGDYNGKISKSFIIEADSNTSADKDKDSDNPQQKPDKPSAPAENKTPVQTEAGEQATTTTSGKATLIKTADSNKRTVTVSSTIKIDGVEYQVTEIGSNAFKDLKKTTTVVLPNTVEKIKANAFAKSKVRTVKLTVKKGKKLKIDKKAFKNSKVQKIQITISKKATEKEIKTLKKALMKAGIQEKNIKFLKKLK